MKYTREDIIIWADDPRLEGAIGKECWYENNVNLLLLSVNNRESHTSLLEEAKFTPTGTFKVNNSNMLWNFIILKKEPKKKIVPFDLSLKEDRDAVIGKRICSEDCDTIVCGCSKYSEGRWEFELSNSICPVDARYVMRDFVFADTGKPVGKEVEDENR